MKGELSPHAQVVPWLPLGLQWARGLGEHSEPHEGGSPTTSSLKSQIETSRGQ